MGYFGFGWGGDYVSVAEKRRRAEKKVAELKKQGRPIAPVNIEGRTIARSFWGKSWCSNLERYSDFASRLPRGRSYVRNGAVIDLQIAKGQVTAQVNGSDLYDIKIKVAPVAATRWSAICRDCTGTIDSLVELLQGRLAKGVMDRVCREGDGLFPAPSEIRLSCNCPDWADMCKHVAAALYGVGARLDEEPQLLFVLRGVDENELLAGAGPDLARSKSAPKTAKVLDDSDVAALFGLEMAETVNSDTPTVPKRRQRSKTPRGSKTPAVKKTAAEKKTPDVKKTPAANKGNPPRATLTKFEPKRTTLAGARKKRALRRPRRRRSA
jgi:uncharacterized Zn finger protein